MNHPLHLVKIGRISLLGLLCFGAYCLQEHLLDQPSPDASQTAPYAAVSLSRPLASIPPATTTPVPSIPFETVDMGLISGFGYYCGSRADGCESPDLADELMSPDAWPCFADYARPNFEGVIRDQCMWASLWEQHTSLIEPPLPMPEVDFDRYAVIAVISGWRPNSCAGLAITSLHYMRHSCTIMLKERVPCPDEQCFQVITNPYHFIKVDKRYVPFDVAIRFDHKRPTASIQPALDGARATRCARTGHPASGDTQGSRQSTIQ